MDLTGLVTQAQWILMQNKSTVLTAMQESSVTFTTLPGGMWPNCWMAGVNNWLFIIHHDGFVLELDDLILISQQYDVLVVLAV